MRHALDRDGQSLCGRPDSRGNSGIPRHAHRARQREPLSSAAEIRKEALQLHTSRIFDNPQWVGYLPFNKRYRPEVWDAANIVFVRMECCPEPGAVTQEQIDRSYMGQIACPHCGRWNTFTILGNHSGPAPISGPIPRSDREPDAKHLISGKDADACLLYTSSQTASAYL